MTADEHREATGHGVEVAGEIDGAEVWGCHDCPASDSNPEAKPMAWNKDGTGRWPQ